MKCLEEYNINIVLAGLDGDFERKPFGQILDLIPYSDKTFKKNALCKFCMNGNKAIFSHRINSSKGDQILVGSTESYTPVCRMHYLMLNKIKWIK